MSENQSRTVEIRVKRFDPETRSFNYRSYKLEVDRFTTVLGALISIKEKQDPTLSMRYSCRMGICGSCGMVINGKPRLACETNILKECGDTVEVEPMMAHPVLKDVVCDFDDFFKKHRSVKPWLIRLDREEKFKAEKEYVQTAKQLDDYLPFTYCIKCGLCVDACPVSNLNPGFLGPQALSQAYRYVADSRDQGEKDRLPNLDTFEGVWGCEFLGACSRVCPKGVDPALAIQLLKMRVLRP
jgi:succinate dehydrogenase / fumarate reductase iron-sulfur subunit